MNRKHLWAAGLGIGALILATPRVISTVSTPKFLDLMQKYSSSYGVPLVFLQKVNLIESANWRNSRVAAGLKNPRDVWGSISYDKLSWGGFQLRPETAADFDPTLFAPNVVENGKRVPFYVLMQRNPNDSRYVDTVARLNDPDYSTRIACAYIAWCKRYLIAQGVKESDPRFIEWLAKSYNQGVGNTMKEIKKQSPGYAAAYWEKYQSASA